MKGHNFGHGRGDVCKKCGKVHVHPRGMLGKKNRNGGFKKGMKWRKGERGRRLSIQKGCKMGVNPCLKCGGYHKYPWNNDRCIDQSKRMKKIMNSPEVKFKLTHKSSKMRKHYSEAAKLRSKNPEYIEKLSKATTEQWEDPISRMKLVRALNVPTKPQLKLFDLLNNFFDGLILEHPILTEKSYRRLDIAQPKDMIDFEYDEPIWHDDDADRERDLELKNLGWTVIRFRGIESLTLKNVSQKVSKLIQVK